VSRRAVLAGFSPTEPPAPPTGIKTLDASGPFAGPVQPVADPAKDGQNDQTLHFASSRCSLVITPLPVRVDRFAVVPNDPSRQWALSSGSSAEFVGESHVAVTREVGIPAENREETMRRLATPEKSKQRRGIILRPIEYNASSLFTFFPEEAGLSKARDVCRLDADRSHFTHKFC